MIVFSGKKFLVLAIGGGGDVVTAAVLARSMRRCGYETLVGSIAWERYVIDPEPGPIPLSSIVGCQHIGEYACRVNASSYATRGSRKVVFQAVNVAKVLREEVVVIDLYGGVEGYRRGVEEVIEHYGLDGIVGVDVGGDVLAYGFEEHLWSPLADSMGLAVLNKFDNAYLVVHSLGSDGELPLNYLYERLSIVIRNGGLIGITGLSRQDRELLEGLLEHAESEASRISLLALNGFIGELIVRLGSRKAYVTPHSLVSYVLDPRIVYKESLVARVVDNSRSLDEARRKLNSIGIYTEYDLEEDLKKLGISPNEVTGELLLSVRDAGRSRLRGNYG